MTSDAPLPSSVTGHMWRPTLIRMERKRQSNGTDEQQRMGKRSRSLSFIEDVVVCSYCGQQFMESDNHPPMLLEIRDPAREDRHDVFHYNRGEWWELVMNGICGEMWRRCYWWREEHDHDYKEYDASRWWQDHDDYKKQSCPILVRRQCRLCREVSKILEGYAIAMAHAAIQMRKLFPQPELADLPVRSPENGVVCSWCGNGELPVTSSTQPRGCDMKIGPITAEQWHETLSFNGGVWWMIAMDGEMWRRCYWWKEEWVNGGDTMLVFHLCPFCREQAEFLSDAVSAIKCTRAAYRRSDSSSDGSGALRA